MLLARDLSARHPGATFVVDVKSTGLYATDPVLAENGATTDYWKTGHSYIKRRVRDLGALAGFEKSGHYFFNPPIGRGYDDGLLSAIAILDLLDRNPGAVAVGAVPRPAAHLVVADHVGRMPRRGEIRRRRCGHRTLPPHARSPARRSTATPIVDLVTVNGVRAVTDDGTWGLVRASSNKPELVVVVESPVSEARMREMFAVVDGFMREHAVRRPTTTRRSSRRPARPAGCAAHRRIELSNSTCRYVV